MHKTLRDKTPSVLLTVFVCSRFVVLRGGWEWVSFDCFQIKMLVTYVGMVYVGLWMSQAHIPQVRLLILARTIWHRSSNSECPKKFLNEKNQNQWTEANLVISTLLHLPRPNENGLSHHFHSHQLILSYLRTFRSQFTYRYAWCCQAFRSTVFSSICQFSVSIAVSCQAYPSHSRCHHCRRRPHFFTLFIPDSIWFKLIKVSFYRYQMLNTFSCCLWNWNEIAAVWRALSN